MKSLVTISSIICEWFAACDVTLKFPISSLTDCDSYCKASKGRLKINMKKYCKKDYGAVRTQSDFCCGLQGRCVTDDLFQASEDRDERSNRKLQLFQPEKRKGSEKVPERKDGDKELSGEGSPSKHLRPSRIKQRL